jgi:hypothetical protein
MTRPQVRETLTIEADLRIDVDGRGASLKSEGRRLTFTSEAPGELWASLGGSTFGGLAGPRDGAKAVGRIAETLAAQGIELHLVGPQGELARLGSGAHSRLGRVLTGSTLVQLGPLRIVKSVGVSIVRGSRLFWPVASVLGVVAAAGATVALRGRRDSGPRRRHW